MTFSAALLITPSHKLSRVFTHTNDRNPSPQIQSQEHSVQRLEDKHLSERIERVLQATGYRGLLDVKVTVYARVVELLGTVSSYYIKQMAQEVAMTVPGLHDIHNGLKVATSTQSFHGSSP